MKDFIANPQGGNVNESEAAKNRSDRSTATLHIHFQPLYNTIVNHPLQSVKNVLLAQIDGLLCDLLP
jgi:hypothetical protein